MILTAFLRCATLFASGLFAAASAFAGQSQYSHGDPTPLEQMSLELINRARSNPTQEGVILYSENTQFAIDAQNQFPSFFTNLRAQLAAYPVVPPLAFHPELIAAARAHSQDMITRNYFSHVTPEGVDPTGRAAALGYDVGVGENIDGAGASVEADIQQSHFGFMVEYANIDTANLYGHRNNILSASYTEIGVGVVGSLQSGRITQDFGGPARIYFLGVAYNDADGSGSYDVGEGVAGITVTPDSGNWFAVTSTSGGFAIPIDPVQTVSDSFVVPFNVAGNTWAQVQPYDAAYRQQQIAAAPTITVNLTWSGGPLTSPRTTTITMKKPVLRNYRIVGQDGYYYNMSMVTSQSVKADLITGATTGGSTGGGSTTQASSSPKDLNGDGKADFLFQNSAGQLYAWLLDGTANTINFATGAGLTSGSHFLYGGALGDWRLVARADVNNDGFADLIFQNSAGQIYVWFLDGTGNTINFATGAGLKPGSKMLYTAGMGDWRIAACTDMNGDGTTDLVFQNSVGQLFVWLLDGTGTAINYATGVGLKPGSKFLYGAGLGDWRLVTCTDMNGDGIPDLVFQNSAGQIYAWILDGTVSPINFSTGAGLKPGSKFLFGGALGDWRVH